MNCFRDDGVFVLEKKKMSICLFLFSDYKNRILTLQNKGNMTISYYLFSALVIQPSKEGNCNITYLMQKENIIQWHFKSIEQHFTIYYTHFSWKGLVPKNHWWKVKTEEVIPPVSFTALLSFDFWVHTTNVKWLYRYTLIDKTWPFH